MMQKWERDKQEVQARKDMLKAMEQGPQPG